MYLFFVASHFALYVAFPVTVSSTLGSHPANLYVYSAVFALVGLDIFGVAVPYSRFSYTSFSDDVPPFKS